MIDSPEIIVSESDALSLDAFKRMDYYVVENYALPIELMMENAGLYLARIIAGIAPSINSGVHVVAGSGNNGGGGLVAARRLAAWGYSVSVELITDQMTELPQSQLLRAEKFGAALVPMKSPDVIVDAMLGFSQRPPLGEKLQQRIDELNSHSAHKISLDLPTGLFDENSGLFFKADTVLTLAAPKKILYLPQLSKVDLFVADLGIPNEIYQKFGVKFKMPFEKSGIVKLVRNRE